MHVRAYEECVTGIQHAFVDRGIGTSGRGGGGGTQGPRAPQFFERNKSALSVMKRAYFAHTSCCKY